MITKDRYSQAFLFLAVGFGVSALFLRADKGYAAATSGLLGVFPLLYLMTRPTKLHLLEEEIKRLSPEFKGENDCKFSKTVTVKIDGIKVKGKRYKFVNGTDVCLNDKDEVVPCGFGSSIMQVVGGGGLEPKSIQSDECWN